MICEIKRWIQIETHVFEVFHWILLMALQGKGPVKIDKISSLRLFQRKSSLEISQGYQYF